MELSNAVRGLVRRLWIVVGLVVVGAIAAFAARAIAGDVYEAKATIVVGAAAGPLSVNNDVVQANQRLAVTVAALATSDESLSRLAAEDEHSKLSLSSLRAKVHARAVADTQIVEIVAKDSDPEAAAGLANDLASVVAASEVFQYKGVTPEQLNLLGQVLTTMEASIRGMLPLEGTAALEIGPSYAALLSTYNALSSGGATSPSVSVVSSAVPPEEPTGPSTPLLAGLGGLGGALIGLLLAGVLEYTDGRLRSLSGIEKAIGSSVLAIVSSARLKTAGGGKSGAERLRAPELAALVRVLSRRMGTGAERSLAVVTATDKTAAGKVAATLASELARQGTSVVALDANPASPTLHRAFRIDRSPGLGDFPLERWESDEVPEAACVSPRLAVVPAGKDRWTLHDGDFLTRLLRRLVEKHGIAIAVGAPMLRDSGGVDLAAAADTVLLVVSARRDTRAHLESVERIVRTLNAKVVGAVLVGHVATTDDASPGGE